MKKTILITGFHRSCTSLAAQSLFKAGLPLGKNMLGPHISNLDGHFEDSELMRIHDQLLKDNNTDWQFHDNNKLSIFDDTMVVRYCRHRSEIDGNVWGIKDPRMCLFLDLWNQISFGASFVFIFRHWSECINSLWIRHSRQLAHRLPENNGMNSDISFWLQSDLAAKMWLSYNQRVLQFINKNPNNWLLIPQKSLLNGYNLTKAVNLKFSLNLNTSATSIVNKEYAHNEIHPNIWDILDADLVKKLNLCYESLCSLNSVSENYELKVSMKLKQVNEIDFLNIKWAQESMQLTEDLNKVSSVETALVNINDLRHGLKLLNTEWPFDNVHKIRAAKNICKQLYKIAPVNGTVAMWEGRIAFSEKDYHSAERYLLLAIELRYRPPYIYNLLANIYCDTKRYNEAEQYYQKAIDGNPENLSFVRALAQFYIEQKKHKQAQEMFELVSGKNKDLSWATIGRLTCIKLEDGLDEAIASATIIWKNNKTRLVALFLSDSLMLNGQHEASLNIIKEYVTSANLLDFMQNVIAKMAHKRGDNKQNINLLLNLLFQHWRKLFEDDSLLESKLGLNPNKLKN